MVVPNTVNYVQYTGPQSSPVTLPFLVVLAVDPVVYLQTTAGATPQLLSLTTDYLVTSLECSSPGQLSPSFHPVQSAHPWSRERC